jgi:hypothetical protein
MHSMNTSLSVLACGVLVLAVVGCGSQDKSMSKVTAVGHGESAKPNAKKDQAPAEEPTGAMNAAPAIVRPMGGQAKQGGAGAGDAAQAQAVPRKIIYNAEVKLVVEDLPKAEESLKELLKKHDGFIAQAEITGSAGSQRSGHWRLRIPVEGFDTFLTELVKLGVPEVNKTDSQDVTDQFYDLQADIKNRKSEEESLRKLLEQTTGKMEDILTIRRELNQVRADIDQKEGRLRRLANLSSLTTINVTFREIKDYVPPQTPTFGSNIASTFSSSIDVLKSVGKGFVLFVVAITPWLPIVLLIAVTAWMMLRRRRGFRVETAASGSAAPPAG